MEINVMTKRQLYILSDVFRESPMYAKHFFFVFLLLIQTDK